MHVNLDNWFRSKVDKLYFHIKDQLPKPKKGLIDAYKDILPTLIKQTSDPNYKIDVALPNK